MEKELTKSEKEFLEKSFTYHRPNENQIERYAKIRHSFKETAETILKNCPDTELRHLALIELVNLNIRVNASIALGEASISKNEKKGESVLENQARNDRYYSEKKEDSLTVELSVTKFSILRKLVDFTLAEMNDRTINDIEESQLNCTNEELTIALSIVNERNEDDPDDPDDPDERSDSIKSTYDLDTIVTNILDRIDNQIVLKNKNDPSISASIV